MMGHVDMVEFQFLVTITIKLILKIDGQDLLETGHLLQCLEKFHS
jgi:hypothetical protein